MKHKTNKFTLGVSPVVGVTVFVGIVITLATMFGLMVIEPTNELSSPNIESTVEITQHENNSSTITLFRTGQVKHVIVEQNNTQITKLDIGESVTVNGDFVVKAKLTTTGKTVTITSHNARTMSEF